VTGKRIAIVGAGKMARARGRAFLDTARAQICAIASRRLDKARLCATELGCETCYDDYRLLEKSNPDAILVEVPHGPQDDIVKWALETGYDVLIGGSLASSVVAGEEIVGLAERRRLIVEAGYQRRYDPSWAEARRLVQEDVIGAPIMAVTTALWNPEPSSWYYNQRDSGGMPLTHLSYAFMNAIRWIMGQPRSVFAMANRKVETLPERVREETCGVLIGFEDGSFASVTASYAGLSSMSSPEPRIVCTRGGVQFNPEESPDVVSMTVFRDDTSEVLSFEAKPSALVRQAGRFLDSLDSRLPALNPPEDALIDVRIAEAISMSAREQRMVRLPVPE
jgi:myo-inositol 2-dehydrogenase/D-chiro-inositol 1-dehydrogenase